MKKIQYMLVVILAGVCHLSLATEACINVDDSVGFYGGSFSIAIGNTIIESRRITPAGENCIVTTGYPPSSNYKFCFSGLTTSPALEPSVTCSCQTTSNYDLSYDQHLVIDITNVSSDGTGVWNGSGCKSLTV